MVKKIRSWKRACFPGLVLFFFVESVVNFLFTFFFSFKFPALQACRNGPLEFHIPLWDNNQTTMKSILCTRHHLQHLKHWTPLLLPVVTRAKQEASIFLNKGVKFENNSMCCRMYIGNCQRCGSGSTSMPGPDPDPLRFLFPDPDPLKKAKQTKNK